MQNNQRLVETWRQAADRYEHAATVLGLNPMSPHESTDESAVVTAFALGLSQVMAKVMVDLHIADVRLRGNAGPAESIAETVMMLLPGIEAEHNNGKVTPIEDLLETLLHAARQVGR